MSEQETARVSPREVKLAGLLNRVESWKHTYRNTKRDPQAEDSLVYCLICELQAFIPPPLASADPGAASAVPLHPDMAVVEIAERIARAAHEGQKDTVTGEPYIQHVERVVALVDGEDAKTVAWLHDVVEDNPGWTFERLEAEGIPARLIRPVSLLTRRPPYTYADYIDDLRADPIAVAVKIADLRDHLRPNCPERLRPRYEAALNTLQPAVPLPPQAPQLRALKAAFLEGWDAADDCPGTPSEVEGLEAWERSETKRALLSASSCEAPAKEVEETKAVPRVDVQSQVPVIGSTANITTGDVPSLKDMLARADAALDVINDLCQGRRRWTMSIPAQPLYDPDLILAASISEMRAALAAHAGRASQGDWQPIETAPKLPKMIMVAARCTKSKPLETMFAYWNSQQEWWYRLYAHEATRIYPTHWMPLPSAPSDEPTEGNTNTKKT